MMRLDLIDDLQRRYLKALDDKNLEAWLALFDSDGQYFLIPADNEASGLPVALMFDDCHERLADRVTYITKVWTFDDYQTRHFVQRLSAEELGGDLIGVESNVSVFMADAEGDAKMLAIGRYLDRVRVKGETALFQSKRLIIDNFRLPSNIVYPL
ncbi:MAG: aromatic-ring-hydroxylating dioxygenase subunit beta [Candidatus Binataceae bacterium]